LVKFARLTFNAERGPSSYELEATASLAQKRTAALKKFGVNQAIFPVRENINEYQNIQAKRLPYLVDSVLDLILRFSYFGKRIERIKRILQ